MTRFRFFSIERGLYEALDRTTRGRVGGLFDHVTARGARRARRDFNRTRRAWLLSIGRHERRVVRLDPPIDFDDMPF